MNDVISPTISGKIESFLRRKTEEFPEIIELENWVRYEQIPRHASFGEQTKNK